MTAGALGMVSPEGRESMFSKVFSAYMGGARKFKNINDYLYQPSRPAVSVFGVLIVYECSGVECI